ncbi:MAG: efflux RND transporter periplasmic adaptor subunit [Gammaproteobacteria bacterium]
MKLGADLNVYGVFCLVPVAILCGILFGCGQAGAQSKAAPSPIRVTVSHPAQRAIIEWDEYTGRLEAIDSVEVRARVSGYLQSIHFKDGAMVKGGDLLFVIDPRPYQAALDRAQAQVTQAQARLALGNARLKRSQWLLQRNAASQEDYDTQLGEQRQAAADLEAAKAAVETARLDVEFTEVKAPIGGRISRNFVSEGNLINGGTAQSSLLTRIVSLDPIYCYMDADERAYLKYVRLDRAGQRPSSREVKNPVYLALADEEGFPHKGHIDFVDNRIDPSTGTMRGRAVFPNPDLVLTPGLFARVRLPGSGRYEAILIPDEAIGSDQSRRYVYMINSDHIVERRLVELGPMSHGLRIIRQGLSANDWIITQGLQRARPDMQVAPVKEQIRVESSADDPSYAAPEGNSVEQ